METLIKLTNPEFKIEFMGKDYVVRKANLGKVVQYMQRAKELNDAGGASIENGAKIVSYALWLILSACDPSLTEEAVYDNLPGDTEASELLAKLGFINPNRVVMGANPKPLPTSDQSSSTSQKEPDGDQTK